MTAPAIASPAQVEATLEVAHKALVPLRFSLPPGFDDDAAFHIGLALGHIENALKRVRAAHGEGKP